ncbi:MAG TPA: hypothetical protein VN673_05125, partial [Clostridia bacterium]|nr:hypothetical protein [Clostridia bacterium]
MSRCILASLCCLLALPTAALAQVPLTINGIADRTTYTDTASFSVPVTAGYSYTVTLDGKRLPAVLTNVIDKVDYHEVTAWRTNMSSGAVTNYTVRLIIQSSSRGSPEKGLTVWTPYPPIPSTAAELTGAQLHLVAPQYYPAGLDIPVAAWVDDGNDKIIRGNGWLTAAGFETAAFRILRGHGSGFLPAATAPGAINFDAAFTTLTAAKQINIESATAWTTVSGVLAENTVWPAHSRIALTGHLAIPAGLSLTIGAGSIVKINPLVNITNSGSLMLEGTLAQPIVFTPTTRPAPERNTGAWGGIIMRGGHFVANGAILTGGGGGTSFSFSPGASHRSE